MAVRRRNTAEVDLMTQTFAVAQRLALRYGLQQSDFRLVEIHHHDGQQWTRHCVWQGRARALAQVLATSCTAESQTGDIGKTLRRPMNMQSDSQSDSEMRSSEMPGNPTPGTSAENAWRDIPWTWLQDL